MSRRLWFYWRADVRGKMLALADEYLDYSEASLIAWADWGVSNAVGEA